MAHSEMRARVRALLKIRFSPTHHARKLRERERERERERLFLREKLCVCKIMRKSNPFENGAILSNYEMVFVFSYCVESH